MFALNRALECYHHLDRQIKALDEQIEIAALQMVVALDDSRARSVEDLVNPARGRWQQAMQLYLWEIFGVDLTAIPGIGIEIVLVLLSECGSVFRVFRTSKSFCSWLGLSPGTNIRSVVASGWRGQSRAACKTLGRRCVSAP